MRLHWKCDFFCSQLRVVSEINALSLESFFYSSIDGPWSDWSLACTLIREIWIAIANLMNIFPRHLSSLQVQIRQLDALFPLVTYSCYSGIIEAKNVNYSSVLKPCFLQIHCFIFVKEDKRPFVPQRKEIVVRCVNMYFRHCYR